MGAFRCHRPANQSLQFIASLWEILSLPRRIDGPKGDATQVVNPCLLFLRLSSVHSHHSTNAQEHEMEWSRSLGVMHAEPFTASLIAVNDITTSPEAAHFRARSRWLVQWHSPGRLGSDEQTRLRIAAFLTRSSELKKKFASGRGSSLMPACLPFCPYHGEVWAASICRPTVEVTVFFCFDIRYRHVVVAILVAF